MNMIRAILVLWMLIPHFVFGDTLIKKDGKRYEGAVIKSTSAGIHFKVKKSEITIPHDQVQNISFKHSDTVWLVSKETIKCKIVKMRSEGLLVITEEGPRTIPRPDLQRYFFNRGEPIAISFLPTTGIDFNNEKMTITAATTSDKHLAFNFGGHLPPYTSWLDDFMSGETVGVVVGPQFFFPIKKDVTLSVGVDLTIIDFTNIAGLATQIYTFFLYAGVEYKIPLHLPVLPQPRLSLQAGMMKAEGDIYLYSYRLINPGQNNFAPVLRSKIGFPIMSHKQWSMILEVGYVFARTQDWDMQVDYLDPIKIDLSGPTLDFSLRYQL